MKEQLSVILVVTMMWALNAVNNYTAAMIIGVKSGSSGASSSNSKPS